MLAEENMLGHTDRFANLKVHLEPFAMTTMIAKMGTSAGSPMHKL